MRRKKNITTTPEGLAEPLEQSHRTHVLVRGRCLSYFAGCDYFRLSSHPEILEAVHQGLESLGLTVAASRRTTGNHSIYLQLEAALARFFRTESAIITSNGYMTNLCVAQALAGEITHALIDERAHSSLQDAAQLLGCRVQVFGHRAASEVRRLANRWGRGARILLLTDGLFGHSGEVAPLDQYRANLPPSALLMVDDAHGAGLLGRSGRGTPEFLNLNASGIIQTVTLSKAFGVYGGAVLGPASLRRRIIQRSGYFIGNTPLPLPLARAALAALNFVKKNPALRRRLAFNTAYVKAALREAGLPVNEGPGPIIPIHPGSSKGAQRLSRALLQAAIHPPFIQYSKKDQPYFRFVISSEHEAGQLDELIRVLRVHGLPAVVPPGSE